MGIDVVATAKEFEQHAQKGYLPEYLGKELHNLSDADRLAVARQIAWDMKQQPDPSLPKIDFFDTGDLKAVERTTKSGDSVFVEHVELDKSTGKIKSELNTTNTKNSYEQYVNVEYRERNADGKTTYKMDQSTTLHGTSFKASFDEDRYSYDPKTGKQISHDEKTSWGKQLHEEYDGNSGKQKLADETSANGKVHRTYDAQTGKIQQEDFIYNDKSQETVKYNANGDMVHKEKRYGDNGSKGTRSWDYNPRTGRMIYSDWRDAKGNVTTRHNIDDMGKWIEIKD